MRYFFITDHAEETRLFRHGGQIAAYAVLAVVLLVAPFILNFFYVNELSNVLILSIAGTGLMLLTGYTGLVSFGHGAFLGIGAYANAYLLKIGVPFLISFPAAGLIAAFVGLLIAVPVLRLTGIYLVMATYGFSLIVQEIFVSWTSVTGGLNGIKVARPEIFGFEISTGAPFYFLALVVLIVVILGSINLLRADTGRSLIAIRDSQIAAQSLGIALARYKSTAFALSAGVTGLAGALFGHRLGHISPEAFDFLISLQLLLVVVVGGLGSLHGAVFGAIFVAALPQAIALLRDRLPSFVANQPGLDAGLFGLILMLVVLFEPTGIYGIWKRVRLYFAQFPFYRRSTVGRNKVYMRSERA